MKKVLLINPFVSSCYLYDILKKYAIYSIAVYTTSLDVLSDYYKPSSNLFDEQIYLPNASINEIIEALSHLEFQYIINGNDGYQSVNITDSLTQHFLPHLSNDPASSSLRSDKIDMHKCLSIKNISHIKQIVINKENYFKYKNDIVYPAFIKPRNGVCSLGAQVVNSFSELEHYFTNTTQSIVSDFGEDISSYIIAEKVEGDEYLIDTFSINGEHHISTIQKYNKRNIGGFDRAISAEVECDLERIKLISDYVKQVLDATEFRNGFAHIECFYNHNNTVLIEINPRVSGAKGMVHMVAKHFGQQTQLEIMFNKVFNLVIDNTNSKKFARSLVLYNGGANIMPDLNSLSLEKYGIEFVNQLIPTGQMSNFNITKLGDAAAFVIVSATSRNELEQRINDIIKIDNHGWVNFL